jgi:nucleoside 2-deoxyribosyltransferase
LIGWNKTSLNNDDIDQKNQLKVGTSESTKVLVAFLAAPYSSKFDPMTNRQDVELRKTLENILEILKNNGYEVRSAHVREDWGSKLMKPDDFVPIDFKWVNESDLVIAYIDGTSSALYTEIGWASVSNKTILILHKEGTYLSPLVKGLNSIPGASVEILTFKDDKGLNENLENHLKNHSW